MLIFSVTKGEKFSPKCVTWAFVQLKERRKATVSNLKHREHKEQNENYTNMLLHCHYDNWKVDPDLPIQSGWIS